MAEEDRLERRYCALVQLTKSSDMKRVSADVPLILETVTRWSKGQMEQVCRSNDGQLFGFFFKSTKPAQMLMAEFQSCRGTIHDDSFMVFEIGEEFSWTGFSRAGTWLQRH